MYDYKCKHCENEFEAMKKLSERENADCPKCGNQAIKLISAARGIHGGFYDTITKVNK